MCVRTGAAELSLLVVLVSRVITWLLVTEAAFSRFLCEAGYTYSLDGGIILSFGKLRPSTVEPFAIHNNNFPLRSTKE